MGEAGEALEGKNKIKLSDKWQFGFSAMGI
jgi:hypothetical protein